MIDVARRLSDRWFDRLWSSRRWEIEVAAARRVRGVRLQEGIRLYAPFGLGDSKDVFWVPVRERPIVGARWRALRTPADAERELDNLLREAEVLGIRRFRGGECLGPLGSRIVAEVLLGVMNADPKHYLNVDPNWKPLSVVFGGTSEPRRLDSLRKVVAFAKDRHPL